MSRFKRLVGYAWPYRWRIGTGLGCMLVAQPFQLLHPLFWAFVADQVVLADKPKYIEYVGGNRVTLLMAVLGAMYATYMFGQIIGAVRSYILGVVAQRVGYDIRKDLYGQMQSHSLRFFHDRRSGDLVSRVAGDVDRVQQFATTGIEEIISNIVQLIWVWCLICFVVSWQVAVALLPILVVVAVMIQRFNKVVRPMYRLARDALGEVAAKVQENIMGMAVIKAFSRETLEQDAVEEQNRKYMDAGVSAITVRAKFNPLVQSVAFASNVLMLGVGAYVAMKQVHNEHPTVTVGDLVALRGYWWYLFSPVWSLARVNDTYQRAAAAADRIFDVMEQPVEITDAPDARPLDSSAVRGNIVLRDVTFRYVADHEPVLERASIEVPEGKSLGVVGPSGAGKSTLLSLLLRFYDVQHGSVELDGADVRQLPQRWLREQMGIVTQDAFLFAGTVRENILYGRLDASEEEMFAAAEQANAHQFIRELHDGYDTIVGERGVKLSGGQKQRICIARAFLANPKILLLDEATSAVEPESEAVIQAALERLMRGRTSVVVSHRLSMVRGANQIIVIRHGHIDERGTHEELMARDGWYARMYRLQMGNGDERVVDRQNRASDRRDGPRSFEETDPTWGGDAGTEG